MKWILQERRHSLGKRRVLPGKPEAFRYVLRHSRLAWRLATISIQLAALPQHMGVFHSSCGFTAAHGRFPFNLQLCRSTWGKPPAYRQASLGNSRGSDSAEGSFGDHNIGSSICGINGRKRWAIEQSAFHGHFCS